MKDNNTKRYFFNIVNPKTIHTISPENDSYSKKRIRIVTREGIVLFDSDEYKDEKFIVEMY